MQGHSSKLLFPLKVVCQMVKPNSPCKFEWDMPCTNPADIGIVIGNDTVGISLKHDKVSSEGCIRKDHKARMVITLEGEHGTPKLIILFSQYPSFFVKVFLCLSIKFCNGEPSSFGLFGNALRSEESAPMYNRFLQGLGKLLRNDG